MLPPAFIAQIASSARVSRNTMPRRMAAWPAGTDATRATLAAGGLRRQVCRIVAWTLGWTLFHWWAVIGWPEGLDGSRAAFLGSGVLGLAALAVWRDLRGSLRGEAHPASPPGLVVALRVPPQAPATAQPPADLAA